MKASRTLWGYAEYTRRVRKYAATMESLEEAVERAISECIQEGILADFLKKNRAEAKRMSIYELYGYDAEKYNRMSWEDGYIDGQEILAALLRKLKELGRNGDADRVLVDKEYRDKLLVELKLQDGDN